VATDAVCPAIWHRCERQARVPLHISLRVQWMLLTPHRRFKFRPGNFTGNVKRLIFVAAFLIGVFLGSSGFPFSFTPEQASATHCGSSEQSRKYVAQFSTLAAYGIDGYIGYVPGTLLYPECDKIANFFNVVQNNSNTSTGWVQAGVRIGALTHSTHNATYQVYSEEMTGCGTYSRHLHGTPPANNSAYYVSYTGNTSTRCGAIYYQYAIRVGSWYNAPISYRYLNVASPQWSAQTELGTSKVPAYWEWTGNVTFGHPSTSLANGMAWYNYPAGTRNEWSSSTGATAWNNWPNSPPIRYCSDVAYRAFRSQWSLC
jgi:hypothetical protein